MRYLYITLGFMFIGLGIVGAVVPLLPTTPFLLLALWCFARSSERWKEWLLTNRVCGKYLNSYHNGEGIPLRLKISLITVLWVTTFATILISIDTVWIQLLLSTITIATTVHIAKIKTKK